MIGLLTIISLEEGATTIVERRLITGREIFFCVEGCNSSISRIGAFGSFLILPFELYFISTGFPDFVNTRNCYTTAWLGSNSSLIGEGDIELPDLMGSGLCSRGYSGSDSMWLFNAPKKRSGSSGSA